MDADALQAIQDLGSADAQERTRALARLVTLGPRATDALVAALPGSDSATRALLAQALAEIADPRSAQALAQLANDASPQVRGRGAQGLAALRDPRAPEALARTIDDLPDLLHHPHTVSTYALIGLGQAALAAVLPLLRAGDPATRARAWLVWRSVVAGLPGVGSWDALSRQLGSYAPDAPQAQRDAAARQWEQWLAQRP